MLFNSLCPVFSHVLVILLRKLSQLWLVSSAAFINSSLLVLIILICFLSVDKKLLQTGINLLLLIILIDETPIHTMETVFHYCVDVTNNTNNDKKLCHGTAKQHSRRYTVITVEKIEIFRIRTVLN